jgi:hypothetical protein
MHSHTKGGTDRCRTTRSENTPTTQRSQEDGSAGQAGNGNKLGCGPAKGKSHQRTYTSTQLAVHLHISETELLRRKTVLSPTIWEQPYGTKERVSISTSWIEGAGRGLFGIKPSLHNPLLFKQANEFVCVYATIENVITMEEARLSKSAYIWTNNKNLQLNWDQMALYFDAINNRHHGKFTNDTWTENGNNCKIIWNPLFCREKV